MEIKMAKLSMPKIINTQNKYITISTELKNFDTSTLHVDVINGDVKFTTNT
jgi:hypothetical protein